MKSIDLNHEFEAEITQTSDGKPEKFTAKGMIKPAIVQMPQGQGINFDNLADRVSLSQKINKAIQSDDGIVLLENNEHAELVKALKEMLPKYALLEPALYNYVKDIAALKDVPVEEKKVEPIKKKA